MRSAAFTGRRVAAASSQGSRDDGESLAVWQQIGRRPLAVLASVLKPSTVVEVGVAVGLETKGQRALEFELGKELANVDVGATARHERIVEGTP
jgi:hypothetical protein